MATFVLPAVMSRGILTQKNLASSTTPKRIWDASDSPPSKPSSLARGFLMLMRSGAGQLKIGTANVANSGANEGLPMGAAQGDQLSGAIDGSGANEIFQIAADTSQNYVILEIG